MSTLSKENSSLTPRTSRTVSSWTCSLLRGANVLLSLYTDPSYFRLRWVFSRKISLGIEFAPDYIDSKVNTFQVSDHHSYRDIYYGFLRPRREQPIRRCRLWNFPRYETRHAASTAYWNLSMIALTVKGAVKGHHFLRQHGEPTHMIIRHPNKIFCESKTFFYSQFYMI